VRETAVDTQPDTVLGAGDLVAGKYRIGRLIGQGAMGAVFAAKHETMDRDVAVKMMWPEHTSSPHLVTRFFQEARAAARIENEHVARVFDVGLTDRGAPFLVLELLEGEDLAQVLASRSSIPVPEVVGWILEALEGVAEAHSLGLVHRDLKSANLFLARRRDGTSIVKVLDFGLSKDQRASGAGPSLTTTAAILGSPAYMAPEQLRSARTVDARADIWAVGVVLYELLAGGLPFPASNVADLCVAVLERDPEPLRPRRKEVPPALEDVVRRCLARDPAERFADVEALARALVPFAPPGADGAAARIGHLLRNVRPRASQDSRPQRARRRRAVVVAFAVIAGLVAIGATYWHTHTALPGQQLVGEPPRAHPQ
jgi:serine/threonine-protein kinase